MQETTMKETPRQDDESKLSTIFGQIIFASRWLQLPIYLGLIVVQGIYAYKFMKSLWHLMVNLEEMDSNTIMLAVLNLIDVVMIANLLVMVIVVVMKFLSLSCVPKDIRINRNG